MSDLSSPFPQMAINGLPAIKKAIQHHSSVIGTTLPQDFFDLVTEVLFPVDPLHENTINDGQAMQIAQNIRKEADRNPGREGYYSPNLISMLLNGVLQQTRKPLSDSVYAKIGGNKPSVSENAVDRVIAIAARNYALGIYTRPDFSFLNKGPAL